MANKELPHITEDFLRKKVQCTEFFRIPNTTIITCTLHLASGFTVTGEASTSNPANYNEARGREIAEQKAYKRLADFEMYVAYEQGFGREKAVT